MGPADLAAWFGGCRELAVTSGQRVERHRLADLSAERLSGLVLGRSGKLRAPTLVLGPLAIVGFHGDLYAETFGA